MNDIERAQALATAKADQLENTLSYVRGYIHHPAVLHEHLNSQLAHDYQDLTNALFALEKARQKGQK